MSGNYVTSTANTTQYWSTCGGNAVNSTETNIQTIFRTVGTASNLWINIITNSVNTATVFTFRKNAAAGNQTVSVGGSATGNFTDAVHTDTLASGDLISLQSVPGTTGTFKMSMNAFQFLANADTVKRMAATATTTLSTINTTYFYTIQGFSNTAGGNVTESHDRVRQRKAGTFRNAAVQITANASTPACTFKSRNNTADGNMSASITANTTGLFEDTTNSDTVAVGDDYDLAIATGATTSLTTSMTEVDFVTTTGDDQNVNGFDTAMLTGGLANTVYFIPIAGGTAGNSQTTESDFQILTNNTTTFSELTVNVNKSTTTATTVDLRVNAVSSALTISIANGSTGIFSDSVNTVLTAATDLVNIRSTSGTAVPPNYRFTAIWGNNPSATVPPTTIATGQINTAFGYPYTIWHGSTGMINFGR